ncbi:nitroreductase family deazaflavin-dependent oxidoreductase [Amycolatopsis echigonensis]|uniref:Nitroreductase family deazaflavin-dependent oxidoreductase n=1 Tax=Amycolatopsis echigonensis TaxID=2576905 RepID=A0A8E1W206_9PSEU|nr:nitroreductase family deazaflavin-dependent oxidoreductase [Amycolatopsis echigonensis]
MGKRFLCLTHFGRKSGRRYRTVLEVVGLRPGTGEVLAIAGLGPSSDWFRNIQAAPAAEVAIGRRKFVPSCRILDEPEAVDAIADYERRNLLLRPVLRPVLSRLLGWRYDGSDAARHRLVQQLPIVAFRPRGGAEPDQEGTDR